MIPRISLRSFIKLKFFLLFVIYFAASQENAQIKDQACNGDADYYINPVAISMSPGFIAGAVPYVRNNECSEAGVCRNIPTICKDSSCCIGNNVSSISTIPTLPNSSQCGCWDPKRKTCKPVHNFGLNWNICSQHDHFKISSRFDFTHISKSLAKACPGNSAKLDFDVDKEMGYLKIQILTKSCIGSQNLRNGRNENRNLPGEIIGDVTQDLGTVENDLNFVSNGDLRLGKISSKLKQKPNLRPLLLGKKRQTVADSSYFPNSTENDETKNHSFKCNQDIEKSTASLTTGFLYGTAHSFLNSGNCGNHGSCKVSTPAACQMNRCCMLSNNKNSTAGGCDCLHENLTSCLSDHKILRVENNFCTQNGETIGWQFSVKIPSSLSNNCKDGSSSSWQMVSLDMEINTNDNVGIAIKSKQCVKSNGFVGGYYLEVEEDVKVEMRLDAFQKTIEKLDMIKRDYDQNKLMGKK